MLIRQATAAIGSILLITSFVDTTYKLTPKPMQLALRAVPVAVVAFLVLGSRLWMLDRMAGLDAVVRVKGAGSR